MKFDKLTASSIKSHFVIWILLAIYVGTTQFVIGTLISKIAYTPLFILNYVIPFYLLTLVVFPSYFETQKFKFFIAYVIVILIFIAFDYMHIKNILPMLGGYRKRIYISNFKFLQTSLQHFSWVAFASTGRYLISKSYDIKRQNILKKETILSLEINFLNNQFHSHLTLNFFNFCYSKLMKISNDTAESIATFADTLKHSLNLNSEIYIPLDQEIEYLKNWIHIQKVISYPIYASIKINGDSTNFNILKGLLSVPIENAFRHGNYTNPQHPIEIFFEINQEILTFKVTNFQIFRSEILPTREERITKLKEILNLFYQDLHSISINETESQYFMYLQLKNKQLNES